MTTKEKARVHNEYINNHLKDDINFSIEHSEVLRFNSNTKIIFDKDKVQNTVFNYRHLKCCVLNFASFKHPGGGFITGSIAQEEAICHYSILYPVLLSFQEEYNKNIKMLNNGLYTNFAIYSRDIKFMRDDAENVVTADVLTCAAPNANKYLGDNIFYAASRKTILEDTLKSRIKHILEIASTRCSNLILGAFGCGVFGNNPEVVATIFKDELKNYHFNNVIFSIPEGENYNVFEKVFKEYL